MEPKETSCAICLGALNPKEGGKALFKAECSHTFHFRCIASNVQHANYFCPTCRAIWINLPSNFTLLSYADDEPLPSPSPVVSSVTTVSTTSCSQIDESESMTVKALPEYPALSKSYQSNCFPVLTAIQAPPLSPEASDRPSDRAPIDLVAVLDVSASMKGDKIRLLKQAVGFVVNNLGSADRLSVIPFSTAAWRATPLRRMTDAEKFETISTVNNLPVNGSTNIIEALERAVQVLMQRREKNPVSSIILLSDGQDNQSVFKSMFLRSLHNLPPCIRTNELDGNAPKIDAIPVHTFGFGADHDSTALHNIADGSGGTFSYIETIEIIQDAFARCIGGLLSVVSQGLEVHLSSACQGVQIQSISSGRYRNSIDSDRQHGMIYVGEVYAEEEKKFLAYLSVPLADTDTSKTQLLEVKCSYKDPLSNQNIMSKIVNVEICRPLSEDLSEEDKQVSLEVDRERNRVSIAEGITEAQAMAERGKLSSAQAMLQQRRMELMQSASALAGDALCGRLDVELGEIHERMSSKSEYEGGGKAYAFSRQSAHMNQRASTHTVRNQLPRQMGHFGVLQNAAASPMLCSTPNDEMEYQTSFMTKMVQKSQQSLKSGYQDEKSAASSGNSINQ